jgi:ribonucleoside-triphosphate reductase
MGIDKEISKYIHLSKYARWIEAEGRRETWAETVDRLRLFWMSKYSGLYKPELEVNSDDIIRAFTAVENLEVMPSMRSLMTAGKALNKDNVAGFNCAAIAVSNIRVFDEIFYLLMCGCGVGFSVERQYINKLPEVAEDLYDTDTTIEVRDSKIGWAKGLKELIALLYNGNIPLWDLSSVRPAGARLRTFGGRSSGPAPLDSLFRYTVKLFSRAAGRRLNSIECHDLICKIANTVIVGSVRRSACISLSNLTDDRMRRAKMGEWYYQNPERALANNSVAYTEKPDLTSFLKEFRSMYQSKAGERGLVNKEALRHKAESCKREHSGDYILNPCGEAILRDSGGLCNLTEVIVRPNDTLDTLKNKVYYATIMGTLQSTLSDFRYLRVVWRNNQEEERLLGVSLTGIMDHCVLSGKEGTDKLIDWLREMKQVAVDTNKNWAKALEIKPSKQLTLIKPSGTVSQLTGTSSGIHPRFSRYYLRRYTQDVKDPLTALMKEQGIPYVDRGDKTIFSFPIKSPEDAIVARDMGAIEQLKLWKIYRDHWCDGNPSQTIYYTDNDFIEVQAWVWENWDSIGGLSFIPLDDNIYDRETMPYLSITREEYDEAVSSFPSSIAWDSLSEMEKEDNTGIEIEWACSGGLCEI